MSLSADSGMEKQENRIRCGEVDRGEALQSRTVDFGGERLVERASDGFPS